MHFLSFIKCLLNKIIFEFFGRMKQGLKLLYRWYTTLHLLGLLPIVSPSGKKWIKVG